MQKIQKDQVDLLTIFQIIWKEKLKVFFTTSLTFVICLIFLFTIPKSFEVRTDLNYSNENLFFKYKYLNDIIFKEIKYFDSLDDEFVDYENIISSSSLFEMIVNEFRDYEEMIIALKQNNFVKNKIKDLEENDKVKILIKFAKNFTIINPINKKDQWFISFRWHDVNDGASLFNEALRLSLENVQKTLSMDIHNLANSIDMENKRKKVSLNNELEINKKLSKLNRDKRQKYLIEQSNIAKKLGIKTNKLSSIGSSNVFALNQHQTIESNYPYYFRDTFESNYPYYLRGYLAIDKEIEIIKNRSITDKDLMSDNFFIKEKIFYLETDNTSKELINASKAIYNDDFTKWVNFNFELAEIKNLNKPSLYITLSLIIGFLVGMIYVLIINTIRERKISETD